MSGKRNPIAISADQSRRGRHAGQPTGCASVFGTIAEDLITARWISSKELALETKSLVAAGLELHQNIETRANDEGAVAALGAWVKPAGTNSMLPDADDFSGERTHFGWAGCRIICPPAPIQNSSED